MDPRAHSEVKCSLVLTFIMRRVRHAVLLALVVAVVPSGCVNLTPPWASKGDASVSDGKLESGEADLAFEVGIDDTNSNGEEGGQVPAEVDAGLEGGGWDTLPSQDAPLIQKDVARLDGAGGADAGDAMSGGDETGGSSVVDVGADGTSLTDIRSDTPITFDASSDPTASESAIGTGGATGAGGATGTGGATSTGGTTGTGGALVKLTGTPFGSGPAYSSDPSTTFDKAFDGDVSTYDNDSNVSGGYTGIDLGAGVTSTVAVIRYYPRPAWNDRLVGGKIQCSITSRTAGYSDLYTIAAEPPLAWTQVTIASTTPCRYLRYLGPSNSYTNIAEIEFWGVSAAGGDAGVLGGGTSLVNLAYNKPSMASSQSLNSKDAVYGNDGSLTSEFCPTNSAFPDSWLVDLGAVYALAETDINFEFSNVSYKYKIEVSMDGATWMTTVDQTSNVTRLGGTMTDEINVQARYVRLTISGSSGAGDWGCFWEFLVWGYNTPAVDAGTALSILSVNKPVTASSQFLNKTATRGNDGLLSTSFCADGSVFPSWWRVDLGAIYNVSETDITFEQQTSYYQYTIDVSVDDTNWTTVVDQSSNATRNGASVIDTFSAQARYVRMTILGVSTSGNWACFWEFTVRGQ